MRLLASIAVAGVLALTGQAYAQAFPGFPTFTPPTNFPTQQPQTTTSTTTTTAPATSSTSSSSESSGAMAPGINTGPGTTNLPFNIDNHQIMNLTESGLGIGVASPQTALDVAGEVHVGNSGIACSAAVAGAMRYNATNHAMNYCNGTAWVGFAPSSVNVPLNACNGHYCWPDPSSLTATHLCQLAGYSSMLTYNATFEAGNYWYWNGASYAQHDGSCTSSCSAITSVMCQ